MKTIILLDYDSIKDATTKLDVELNYKDFLDFLKSIHEESDIQTAYAYVSINKKIPHANDKLVDELTRSGYIVRKVVGDNYGINFIADCSQAITLDALRSVYENEATNIILVSNSHKLENLVLLLREKDITVETVFYGTLVDYDLAINSTGFINLDDFINDDEREEEINDNEQNNDGEEIEESVSNNEDEIASENVQDNTSLGIKEEIESCDNPFSSITLNHKTNIIIEDKNNGGNK